VRMCLSDQDVTNRGVWWVSRVLAGYRTLYTALPIKVAIWTFQVTSPDQNLSAIYRDLDSR
jgi:hypothetical protein